MKKRDITLLLSVLLRACKFSFLNLILVIIIISIDKNNIWCQSFYVLFFIELKYLLKKATRVVNMCACKIIQLTEFFLIDSSIFMYDMGYVVVFFSDYNLIIISLFFDSWYWK